MIGALHLAAGCFFTLVRFVHGSDRPQLEALLQHFLELTRMLQQCNCLYFEKLIQRHRAPVGLRVVFQVYELIIRICIKS